MRGSARLPACGGRRCGSARPAGRGEGEFRSNRDRDVSDWLGWPLQHPRYRDRPITLRLLLSHRSSITDTAGYVIPYDAALKDKLDDPNAWDAEHAPGTFFRYTNLNFPVVASVMERATGERFDRLMQRLVLEPLGVRACFNWASCPPSSIARAVVLYDANGEVQADDLRGEPPRCPVVPAADGQCDLTRWQAGRNGAMFSPQGGLRISARDLAAIGQMLLNDGSLQRAPRFLRKESIRTLTTPVWTYDGGNGETFEAETGNPGGAFFCRYGLAVQTLATNGPNCRDDPFGDGQPRIGHAGEAYGLVSGLWIDRRAGRGVAYFIVGGDLQRKGERSAFYAVEEQLLQAR
ncbi:MAG: class A beta-lactamase-related serine hydrolase [Gammaproteobacteria bacterium]|nr:class A beta-lactamase-related serine hydrolase [Gammaproteobacteria bacterium]